MSPGRSCTWQADITGTKDGERMEAAIPVSTQKRDQQVAKEEAVETARELGYSDITVRQVTLTGEG